MKLPVALAIVVGVVGGILTWLYLGPLSALGLFVPATFMGAAAYFATELLGDQLRPVADAENRDTEVVDAGVEARRAVDVHALRPTAEDDRRRWVGGDLGGGDAVRHDLAVHVQLAHPSGDELGVLRSEVHDQHGLTTQHHVTDGT